MKNIFDQLKVGDYVYDCGDPITLGRVKKILKTRVKILFSNRAELVAYDKAHVQFLRRWK